MKLIDQLRDEAAKQGRPLADVMAEALAGALMSDYSDPNHVHWLDFLKRVEDYIHAYNR